MAGMGLEGAGGAVGTFQGLQDWMRQRRTQVVQGQRDEDRLREQRLQNEALATEAADRERTIGRQRVLDEHANTVFEQGQTDRATALAEQLSPEQMQETFAAIDAADEIPQLAKIGLKLTIQKTKTVPPQAYQYLRPKEPKAPHMVMAPNGQLINADDPNNVNKNFAAPREPKTGAEHPLAVAPNGQVWNPYDRSAIGQNLGKPPAPPTVTAKQRDALQNASQGRQLLMQLKPLFTGDKEKGVQGVQDILGPFGGRIESFQQTYGLGKNNPQFQQFEAATARLKNATIQAITGAAVGVKEEQRILDEVPTINDIGPKWEQKWLQSIRNLEYLENAIHEQAGVGTQMPDTVNDAMHGGSVTLTPPGHGAAAGGSRDVFYDATGKRVR